MTATPIDVSSILREHLFDAFDTIVMTAATLAVSGRFDFLKQRLGLQLAQEMVLPHEFDYGRQALLYIPAGLPDVRNPAFVQKAAEEISRLLKLTQGRGLSLSFYQLQLR